MKYTKDIGSSSVIQAQDLILAPATDEIPKLELFSQPDILGLQIHVDDLLLRNELEASSVFLCHPLYSSAGQRGCVSSTLRVLDIADSLFFQSLVSV